jgi:glycosyltransferase involved in cell wall biosynthesis
VPNYNGASTIAACLESIRAADPDAEVVVVDDCSLDDSVDVIRRYPCTLVRLARHSGAATARNTGVAHCSGDVLFFTDADCQVLPESLARARAAVMAEGDDVVVGGTYTEAPADSTFFSWFQSIFVNYSETKSVAEPDYIATHAMALTRAMFLRHGGFRADFLPILEDVEFSHRLRRRGCRLRMLPELYVRHTFDFSLVRSLRNACRKSLYWTAYSLRQKDLLSDSGTASVELKFNVVSWLLLLALASGPLGGAAGALLATLLVLSNAVVSRHLLWRYVAARGWRFGTAAGLYYLFVYPAAIAVGVAGGIIVSWRQRARIQGV